jgi:hypothetical protein
VWCGYLVGVTEHKVQLWLRGNLWRRKEILRLLDPEVLDIYVDYSVSESCIEI